MLEVEQYFKNNAPTKKENVRCMEDKLLIKINEDKRQQEIKGTKTCYMYIKVLIIFTYSVLKHKVGEKEFK